VAYIWIRNTVSPRRCLQGKFRDADGWPAVLAGISHPGLEGWGIHTLRENKKDFTTEVREKRRG
jgi:hypothetical protein